MQDRRKIYIHVPQVEAHAPRDRRSWSDRRQHPRFARILFADVVDLWNRLRS
jgi:hypothetical protein